jgi:methylated-DNA-[protein]-cysteine S-methyltransferase
MLSNRKRKAEEGNNDAIAPNAPVYKPPKALRLSAQTKAKLKEEDEDMKPQLARIDAATHRTPFERRVWTALCAIPRGRYTTYGLLSAHLGTSPRAVGNALRRNPFAPGVPCHRVVATGGRLGGFKGAWPRSGEGITLDEKRMLLRTEGVRFDGEGRVVGTPWVFPG